MSWKDPNELVVASNGEIYIAAVGSDLPDDPTESLSSSVWHGLGYATEDGVTLNVAPEIAEFGAWQSKDPVRREITAREITASFSLEQWNEDTVVLAFGGGEITEPSPGVYRFDFPGSNDALDERALIIDAQDGEKHYRYVFPRGNVTDAVETQLVRSELAVLPVTFKMLAPDDGSSIGYILTDDPAFAAGS